MKDNNLEPNLESGLNNLRNSFMGDEWCEFKTLLKVKESVEIEAYIQQNLSWFAGHFPGQPVLPGVVQTHWACELAQHLFELKGLKKVNNLKFKTMILPETHLRLNLTFNVVKNSITFTYKNDDLIYSNGSLLFTA